ncbi:methyltransferase-like protein 17, mitochondrial isoform X2 [Diprion similis]|uniref:methyltransferase-like protein 17, mitochondrial isoform X2 n=1 Tax=Diprion similis TaxID=362088 RepID=UPI001EF9AB61|nr:methyltransferase-like protein 17, mitochondrial isoform X2 [Diprion similis]
MGETSARVMVKIDETVNKQIESDELHPKRHPGIIKSKAIELPKWVEKAMVEAAADHPMKPLRQAAGVLANYLNQRHPPMEKHDFINKVTEVQELMTRNIDLSKLSTKEIDEFWSRNQNKVKIKLKQKVYAWAPVEYDAYKSLCYMLARGAQEYSVLHRIFKEIHLADEEFQPKTLFDFGSGIGTVTWVASQFWIKSLQEYYCVDSSGDMNQLAESIIANHPSKLKEVYFRQFLPSSSKIKSDIVVSAFSLFELPNVQARLDVVLNLWMRTNNYLVIVEQGTNAGFKIVNEARDFILNMSIESLETDNPNPFHVFAPCPHDTICPRYIIDTTPCNFESSYFNALVGKQTEIKKERFSYVVLKKGERPADDPQWPRIVRPCLFRSKHIVCRMCTGTGKLEEIVFTAAKHGKPLYKCVKNSDWGDKLPLQIINPKEPDSND